MPQTSETLRALAELLQFKDRLLVVDIGANPIGDPPPYAVLQETGLVSLVGFEPQESAYQALLEQLRPDERILPYAVGDGRKHTLNVYKASGLTSLFKLRNKTLRAMRGLSGPGRLIGEVEVDTRRLDSIKEIDRIDFLKIDIQGGELAVFKYGKKKLANTLAIQTEVGFFPLYEGQPLFGDVDVFLRSVGFAFHRFMHVARFPLGKLVVRGRWRRPMHQALDGDVVYTRDFSEPERWSDDELVRMGLLAHGCFASYDLTSLCIGYLVERGVLAEGTLAKYAALLPDEYTA